MESARVSNQTSKYITYYLKDNGYSYNISDVEEPFTFKASNGWQILYICISKDYHNNHREMIRARAKIKKQLGDGVDFKCMLVSNFNGNGLNLYEYGDDRYTFTLCDFKLRPRSYFKRIFKFSS